MASPTKLPDDPHDDELRAFIDPIGHLLQRSEKGGAVGAGGDIAPDERGHSRRDTGSGAEPAKVRDAREAVERLRGAAAQGHPSAIWLLGEAHESGEGVAAPDAAEAARLYVAAAELGCAPAVDACRRLGLRFRARRPPAEPEGSPQPPPARYVKPPYADAFTPGMGFLGSKSMAGRDDH